MSFVSGSGTLTDPYHIYTVSDLLQTTASSNYYHYILMNDLDLSAYSPWKTLVNSYPAVWVGSLDGNNKVIRNLTLTPASIVNSGPPYPYDYVGLFGDLNLASTESAYIKNLYIDNVTIQFESHSVNTLPTFIGALCAINSKRDIINVHITNLSASFVLKDGNIISYAVNSFGDTYKSNVYSCSISASYFEVYGVIDDISEFEIGMFGSVYTNDSYSQCYVKDCTAKSNVLYTDTSLYGDVFISPFTQLYGYAKDMYVLNCLMTSSNYVVGLAKMSYNHNIMNIYTSINPGNTPPENIYPFIYINYGGIVSSCYYESESYSFDNEINIPGVIGLTTNQMKLSESYQGWDFNSIWRIDNV